MANIVQVCKLQIFYVEKLSWGPDPWGPEVMIFYPLILQGLKYVDGVGFPWCMAPQILTLALALTLQCHYWGISI